MSEVEEFHAVDRVKIVRYALGTPVYVGSAAWDTNSKSDWTAFKVEEDANGRNVYFRPKA